MKVFLAPLQSKEQTGRAMYKMTRKTAPDIALFYLSGPGGPERMDKTELPVFFGFVKNIPYRQDEMPVEIISRPRYSIENRCAGLDCKKKAQLIGAWLYLNGIPFRYVSTSKRPDGKITHVFPQGKIGDRWINLDATYPSFFIGQQKQVTNFQILKE